jgi:predicted dehydrogenase
MATAGSDAGLRIVVVGLRFGASFVPIYQRHPDVGAVGVCDTDPQRLEEIADRHGVRRRFDRLDQVLESGEWDAVHLVTPVPLHVEQALAALRTGVHCACAVPAGTSLEGLRALVAAQRESGRSYMMMETAVYTREFLYLKTLYEGGHLGRIQFLRGAHYQDMDGWPPYWAGLPPMHYATHALGPLLHLTGARASAVHAMGSGQMRAGLHEQYSNPYPIETATFRLEGPGVEGVVAEVTRSLFETAVTFKESFDVYGDKATFLWRQVPDDPHALIRFEDHALPPEAGGAAGRGPRPSRASPGPPPGSRERSDRLGMGWRTASDLGRGESRGRKVRVERPEIPYRPDRLPPALAEFAQGGHGGSHPHLVHEFVRSIVEGRPPAVDAVRAANWTAAGLCAHESAMRQGEGVLIPDFA